ncbi:MAG TPA: hypothetical protein VH583_13300 [Vicinamibacterales bacterium]|jgi:hypothetical protein
MRMLAAVLLAAAVGTAQGDLVELDVVVIDHDGRPVHDLGRNDFQIKEDGHQVELKTFVAASSDEHDTDPDSRQLVLLLDDTAPVGGTAIIQAMAQAVLFSKRPGDDVTVVRLNNDRDEPYGDADTALERISHYRAGAVPLDRMGTGIRMLNVLSRISRQLEAVEHQRKLVVCIGGPNVCNVLEPQPRGYSLVWKPWVDALSAAARANVAVYAAMPVRPGSGVMIGGGLIDFTGGAAFYNNGKFEEFVKSVWREATDYYLLGYWPSGPGRELHEVEVKVARKGLHVRVRRERG